MVNIGFFTYLAAAVSFTVLGALLVIYRRVKPMGPSLFIACVATALWAAILASGNVSPEMDTAGLVTSSIIFPPQTIPLVELSELARNACWLIILLQLLGLQSEASLWSIKHWRWRRTFFPLLASAVALIAVRPLLPLPLQASLPLQIEVHYQLVLAMWLVIAVLGLLLIEQLFRNASQGARWSIKYLCLGLGTVFVYDFFMYSEALLFRKLDTELWQARGLVNALVTPLLVVAIARNSSWRVNLHVSRQVVFHTVTLMGAGLYLLGMALAGYFINYLGGSWGGVLQMGFLAAAAALLVSLLFSGKLRAHIQVFLSKHFFSYRYDYRDEWLKFTRALASLNHNVAEGVIRTMAPLASSPAGMLWAGDDGRPMHLLAHWQMPPPLPPEGLGALPAWLQAKDWVIDIDEWRRTPDSYDNLTLPRWLQRDLGLWLIIPLFFGDRLEAVLILKKSDLKHGINWEDRDLLKTAGRQAATHLAQHLASQALVEARQFDAFNRLSAYVVHDLKNILAQQSLIVSNAVKHRSNPAFVDDMISTVENSVARMQRLMEQMRSGVRTSAAARVCCSALLQDVISARQLAMPQAVFDHGANGSANDSSKEEYSVDADRERLATVFSHLIQNAQEATPPQGQVSVRLCRDGKQARIEIEDTGRGMDADFIRDRLFHPFESTKGLTGMGIGAFESRDYIRQLGGDISVVSVPGKGSTFSVTIPLAVSRDSTVSVLSNPASRQSAAPPPYNRAITLQATGTHMEKHRE